MQSATRLDETESAAYSQQGSVCHRQARPAVDHCALIGSLMSPPTWKLPPGVSRGTWDYVQSRHIASDYDHYFADHPLLQLDMQFLRGQLPPRGAGPNATADCRSGLRYRTRFAGTVTLGLSTAEHRS